MHIGDEVYKGIPVFSEDVFEVDVQPLESPGRDLLHNRIFKTPSGIQVIYNLGNQGIIKTPVRPKRRQGKNWRCAKGSGGLDHPGVIQQRLDQFSFHCKSIGKYIEIGEIRERLPKNPRADKGIGISACIDCRAGRRDTRRRWKQQGFAYGKPVWIGNLILIDDCRNRNAIGSSDAVHGISWLNGIDEHGNSPEKLIQINV